MSAQQGKKDVAKLEANPGIMTELEDIECCAVSGSERDLGVIARVPIAIIILYCELTKNLRA